MNNTLPRYADWKAPDEDGQFLLWPDSSTILRQTTENRQLLSNSKTLIQGVPLGDLRKRQRQAIGHQEDDQPLIATGHQTELYHPGVWVKDALTNSLAHRLGGQAWHFAVDTDSPKHLHLRWPGGSMPVSNDPGLSTAAWSALLTAPAPGHIEEIQAAIGAQRQWWDFDPVAGTFLAALKTSAAGNPSLVNDLTSAIGKLDQHLGLEHKTALMSPVWTSEPFLVFAHHLLARAAEFAGEYNAALNDFRKEQRITSPGRPMPDLEIQTHEVETPFWLDDLANETRVRLVLKREHDGWALTRLAAPLAERVQRTSNAKDRFIFQLTTPAENAATTLSTFLQHHNLRLAPRALPLTLFFRLFLADQFIHGIGGGRYDQVTDRIISTFFKIEPPRFSVTTATLYFPAAKGQKRVSLRPLLQEGRRLRHGSFWREKRDLADKIATLPRRSRARHDLFFEMHANLARQASSETLQEWAKRLDHATHEQMRQKAVFDRELFFGMQSEERLREMISRYDEAIST